MRILQLHTAYRQAGGEDRVVATEARLLRDAGHEVITYQSANPEGVRTGLSLAAAPWNPARAQAASRVAARLQPDVAHVHNTWFAMSPAVLAPLRRLGIPVVMTLHNYRLVCAAATLFRDGATCEDCVGTHPWHGVRHACYRGSRAQSAVAAATIALHARRGTWHRDVDRFLALTEFGRQEFIAGGLPAARIAVKSNSVDDPGTRPEPPSASRTVVFLGRLTEEKGIRTLLDAWRRSPSQLRLVIVGTGPLEAQVRREASARVRVVGSLPLEEVTSLLLTARALVLPSIWFEGQGLVALEAAAAGLPVVLSDLGAMAGLFAPGADELLFPAGDVDALVGRLARLEDDRFVDGYAAHTRRCFEERYTHDVGLRTLEDAYRDAIEHAVASDGRA
ncbi:glycosyltransferase [Nitriliruptor alkaliphilus]|uniref:glycosyltransferase n=1 Tax=Nitriliruptor alkaliphilus TaxID=427918 RepID=UPI000697318F|nr:glycosyltransferase [Nitriliruptor alkaliphilus]